MKKNKTIFIIAGESSGDLHGAGVMREMKSIDKSIIFVGLGGERMAQQGLQSLIPIEKLAVMGFWEVAKNIFFFIKLKKTILQKIKQTQPDKIMLIDYPGFNLSVAKNIQQKFNIPIIYYISPQLWAWKEKRIEHIKQYIDKMIVVFPFEKDWYYKRGVEVEYFGHPIIDTGKQYKYTTLDCNNSINIALCPGSREQEINRHMPILCKLIKQYPSVEGKKINFIIIRARGLQKHILTKHLNGLNVTITDETILQTFQKIHFGIVASGTASLESAITTRPLIVVYKMSWISWFITKKFVKIPFACIVNILAGEKMIPELLQDDFTVKNLKKYLDAYLEEESQTNYEHKINNIIELLGSGDSYKKTAEYILNY